jgi:hypothetical protein
MDSNVKALIVKKFKDAEMDLDVGRHWIEETVVVRIVIRRFKTGHSSALENRPPCGGYWVEESS